ncbi:hypothetical protein [Sorangium sp. So ce1097]|uniref:hypothetical protein n=1 Tax=Sorangium sp. So ce1097 TaxID=3133330 RepID=UPI003F624E0F
MIVRLHGRARHARYEQYVHHCAALLDANVGIERAWRASRRRTALDRVAVLLAITALGFGRRRYVVRDALATSSGATSTSTATTSGTASPVASFLGRWRAEDGDVFEATTSAGADVKFTVMPIGPSSPYKPGDLALTVTSSSDSNTLQVEVLLKLGLPAGVRLDAAAGQVQRVLERAPWQAATRRARGGPAHGRRHQARVPIMGLDLQGGRVVSRKK